MKITKIYSKRKTLALQVLDGNVIARIPYGMNDQTVDAFIESKRTWLEKRIAMYQPLGYQKDCNLRLFGVNYNTIEVEARIFSLQIKDAKVIIQVPKDKNEEWVSKRVDDTMKQELNLLINQYLEKYCSILKIEMPKYKIRKYKRLYGRCSRGGDLAFNTYLYHERPEFIEYVVVHELAHLFEFNHSNKFYDVVRSMMPNYKEVISRKKRIS